MPWMPFTVHYRLHPDRPGKRFEYIRDLQKLGYLIYQALTVHPNLNLALPGGQAYNGDKFSDLVYGTAVKPQIGDNPAQAQITGFWQLPSDSTVDALVAPQQQQQLISGGQWLTGPHNQIPAVNNPNVLIQEQVRDLYDLLLNVANAGIPGHYDPVTVFRLDYANIVWGDRGRSFPL